MIAAVFLLSVIWLGFVLDDEFNLSGGDLLVRAAAAIVLGAFWGAWIVFLLSWVLGFNLGTIALATGLVLGLDIFAARSRGRDGRWFAALFRWDRSFWQAAGFPVALLTLYFSFCVWTDAAGDILFRGNTRDLAFHLATVSAFVEQSAFPPFNPQSGAAQLSYHFMANFFSAILCKGGFELYSSLKLPMVLFAFVLGTLTCHLLYTVLRSRLATLFAALLFFLGHIGVVNVLFGLAGHPSGNGPLSLASWASIEDHVSFPYFNFTNVVIDFFQPQLPFLFGFPLAALVLVAAYRKFVAATGVDRTSYFLLAILAFFPLLHIHTFLTLAPLIGGMVLTGREPPRAAATRRAGPLRRAVDWLLTEDTGARAAGGPPRAAETAGPAGAGPLAPFFTRKFLALLLATVPIGLQLGFILAQKKTAGFSGFDVARQLGPLPEIPELFLVKRPWFWLRAAGLPLVLGLAGFGFSLGRWRQSTGPERRAEAAVTAFFCTGFLFFLVINFYRFTPNWGDNNKFFLYWHLALCLYGARLLVRYWDRSVVSRVGAVLLVALASVVPVGIEWGERLRRTPEQLFSAGDRNLAEWIKLNTPRDAVFLTANSTVHLVPALAGRRVVNGSYTRETGFADNLIEDLVARAYREANPGLITQPAVTHIIIGPEEESVYSVNRAAMQRHHKLIYDQSCLGVRHVIYEARQQTAAALEREKAAEASRPFVGLSELQPDSVQQWGTLRYDLAFGLQPLTLGGRQYSAGLGTHAPSEIRFSLDGRYTVFESDIGLDDSQLGGPGSIVFEVWLDDRRVFESTVLHAGDPSQHVRIELGAATKLRLVVTDAGDGNHCDHADWADARFVRK